MPQGACSIGVIYCVRAPQAAATGAMTSTSGMRPRAAGKFFFAGDEKLYVRGVTYGTFASDRGADYPAPDIVVRDLRAMREHAINALRTYTVPPGWLLDLAHEHGVYVVVGLAWETHIAFLDDKARARSIEERVRAGVRACRAHPAVLAYLVGNEIPASIVRWHGPKRVERYIERLYGAAKDEDPDGLVTYANFPSTEYLQLPFLDFDCFNVYLEGEDELDAYLARLQNLAGDRPLMIGEIGLDSRTYGEDAQAAILGRQVRTAFASGCAGAFVFSWTDEWYRGGYAVEDWTFGVTDRDRRPKAALAAVHNAFRDVPLPSAGATPRVSVVVCTHNGERTLDDCLRGLRGLEYPNFEVIVVDDGSSDTSAAIAERNGCQVIRTDHRGLSAARNAGLNAADGEIVAYIDDDCVPDPHWLDYLVSTFATTPHAGIGGPNIPPPDDDGFVARSIAKAPGSPIHVLLSDEEAEHIPGCNMAFRKERLLEIGGFDPQFRVAGDDVDICWRLQERGWTLGFSPAAMVWHHRRKSLRAFFKQQREYGKAEALLERKWPERYNSGGHVPWTGRVYGAPLARAVGRVWRIYYGTWGSNLFQPGREREPGLLATLPLIPEWFLVIGALAVASALASVWQPLVAAVPLLIVALATAVLPAFLSARAARSDPMAPPLARLARHAASAASKYLERAMASAGRADPATGGCPTKEGARSDSRRPVRRVGSAAARRRARRRPHSDSRRGARRRQAVDAIAVPAAPDAPRPRARRRFRRPCAHRRSR
jgi:GT2 family glycosyltransferase